MTAADDTAARTQTTAHVTDAPTPGEAGPGLAHQGSLDPLGLVAAVFAVLGLTPAPWWGAAIGFHAFGPLQLPAIAAIVAVVFGGITVLRSAERGEPRSRLVGAVAAGLGLLRLFIYPLAGW